MIAEKCRELRVQLEEVAKADERARIVDQLNSRRDELVELHATILTVTDSLKAISNRTAIIGTLDSTKLIERIQKIRENFVEDPLSITKGQYFSNMRRTLDKFAEEGTTAAEATWGIYMPRARPTLDGNQVAQAEQQRDFSALATQLQSRAKYADNLSKKPPANEQEFLEIESVWEDIRRLISKLPDVASDPKVQEFLKAANSQRGAPLNLLTDEVRAWLSDNNIAEKYRITTV